MSVSVGLCKKNTLTKYLKTHGPVGAKTQIRAIRSALKSAIVDYYTQHTKFI